jgi:ABC-2 type transport system ATP-binding protein
MLARTLLHNPPILLLDEPTIGLDAEGAVETREFLKTLNSELGKTILFTSHVMSEVQQLCERIVVINNGRIIADTTPDELRFLTRDVRSVEVKILDGSSDAVSSILSEKIPCVQAVTSKESHGNFSTINVAINCDESEAIPTIAKTLSSEGIKVMGLQAVEPSLEEAFIRIVKRDDSEKQTEKSAEKGD